MAVSTVPSSKISRKELQSLYETALWYGYATHNEQKLYLFEIIDIAEAKKINLQYICAN